MIMGTSSSSSYLLLSPVSMAFLGFWFRMGFSDGKRGFPIEGTGCAEGAGFVPLERDWWSRAFSWRLSGIWIIRDKAHGWFATEADGYRWLPMVME